MGKYFVEVEGYATVKRHRCLQIYAKTQEEAVIKAKERFINSPLKDDTIISDDVKVKSVTNLSRRKKGGEKRGT